MTATDETLSNEVLIPLNETGTVKKQLADMLNSSINPDHSKPFGMILRQWLYGAVLRMNPLCFVQQMCDHMLLQGRRDPPMLSVYLIHSCQLISGIHVN